MKVWITAIFVCSCVSFVLPSAPPPCPSDVTVAAYFPDSDCTKFWECGDGIAYQLSCAPGTYFNPNLNVCDYPQSAGCTGQGWSTSTPRPTSTRRPRTRPPRPPTPPSTLPPSPSTRPPAPPTTTRRPRTVPTWSTELPKTTTTTPKPTPPSTTTTTPKPTPPSTTTTTPKPTPPSTTTTTPQPTPPTPPTPPSSNITTPQPTPPTPPLPPSTTTQSPGRGSCWWFWIYYPVCPWDL